MRKWSACAECGHSMFVDHYISYEKGKFVCRRCLCSGERCMR